MNEFNFSTLVKRSQNYSPSSLMHNYARQHPTISFGYSKHGNAYLKIAGIHYFYHHWRVIAVSPRSEMVTVYLNDLELVSMPGTEGDWEKKHWGGAK